MIKINDIAYNYLGKHLQWLEEWKFIYLAPKTERFLRRSIAREFRYIDSNIECTHTKGELLHIANFLIRKSLVEGSIIECGVYKGGATCKLSTLCNYRFIYACDSFEGLPKPNKGEGFKEGEYKNLYENYLNVLDMYGMDNIEVVQGWFKDTLPNIKDKFVMVFEDADIASSVSSCLDSLWHKVIKGGRFYTHEYTHPQVINEFENRGLKVKKAGWFVTCPWLGYVEK